VIAMLLEKQNPLARFQFPSLIPMLSLETALKTIPCGALIDVHNACKIQTFVYGQRC